MVALREPAAALRSNAVDRSVAPRLLTEADIAWMLDLGRRRYSNRFDPMATEGWFRNIVLRAPLVFLPVRLDGAFLIAALNIIPWAPGELEANVVLVVADEGRMWQALELLRFSIDWAKMRRATEWRLTSETEVEFGPFARRLGANELSPRYCLRLA
jgi:hypothetical protein